MEKPTIIKAFKKLKEALGQTQNEESVLISMYYLKQYQELHEITASLPGNQLLDWGAGYGHFAFVQSKLGKTVKALSSVEDEYTIYTKTLVALFEKGSFKYKLTKEPIVLPYEDNSFDIAVSCGVLEHVREFGGNDRKSLSELFRILKKSGSLVIGYLPNTGSWIEAFSRRTGRIHHTFLYTKKEIIDKVTEAGFVIKKHKRYAVLPKNSLAIFLTRFNEKNELIQFLTSFSYALDHYILSKLFPWIAQNHLSVLQKE